MLSRYEVAPFPKMDHFDSKLHRVLQVVPTDNPELDGQIVSVLKQDSTEGIRFYASKTSPYTSVSPAVNDSVILSNALRTISNRIEAPPDQTNLPSL